MAKQAEAIHLEWEAQRFSVSTLGVLMKKLMFCLLLVSGLLVSSVPVNAGAESVTTISTPKPELTKSETLNSVSCVSTDFCVAVGSQNVLTSNDFVAAYVDQVLIKMWDGITWSVMQSPIPATKVKNYLTKVACVSRTFCKAVGYSVETSFSNTVLNPLIMNWNGISWSLDAVPDSSLLSNVGLVSCPSITSCFAVGVTKATGFGANKVPSKQVFLQWDGSNWVKQISPEVASEQKNVLYSISCTSSTFCMAVGFSTTGSSTSTVYAALIQTWDGLNWTTAPAPNVNPSQKNTLNSVSCLSSTYCVAVGTTGQSTDTSATQTLALVWDGTSWTLSQSPNTAVNRNNSLSNVLCVSAGNCLASGTGPMGPVTDITAHPLVIRLSGNNWAFVLQSGLIDLGFKGYLGEVSCVGTDWCMILGQSFGYPDCSASCFSGSILLRPAKAALVSAAKKTLASSKLTKNAGISVPKGAKVVLSVATKYKKTCNVVGSTVKTIRKGTCPVKVVVTTKTGQKTSGTTSIKVK
jgi:hypothetical protein